MKSVVDWVLARPHRVIVLAVVLAPLFQPLSAGLIALETAKRGAGRGAAVAACSTAGILILALVSRTSVALIGGVGAATFVSGVVLGLLLRSGGGLRLAFQVTVLLSVAAVVGISVLGAGAGELFKPMLDQLAQVLQANGATPAEIENVHAAAPLMLGLFAAGTLAALVAALFLAYWWLGLAEDDRRFGLEFRDLKLGRVLGLPATILVLIGLVLEAPLVQNLTPLALFGFLFQGLAVLHAWAYARHWHPGFLVPIYVLLITPFVAFVVLGLSGVGLVDNWFDLRALLRRRS
jgi:hypothetical protein